MDPAPPPVSSQVSPYPRPQLQGDGPACPKCSSNQTKVVKYTWWGGVLAPKLMNLQKCDACNFLYNRNTRKSVTTAIWVYNIVVIVVTLSIVFAVASAL